MQCSQTSNVDDVVYTGWAKNDFGNFFADMLLSKYAIKW